MNVSVHQLLLAIFIALGLLLSPLPVSVARDMQAADQMQTMADETPGCPGPMTADECHKCPLMVVCLVKNLAYPSDFTAGFALAYSRSALRLPSNDSLPIGLGHSPPARPPRTHVIPA